MPALVSLAEKVQGSISEDAEYLQAGIIGTMRQFVSDVGETLTQSIKAGAERLTVFIPTVEVRFGATREAPRLPFAPVEKQAPNNPPGFSGVQGDAKFESKQFVIRAPLEVSPLTGREVTPQRGVIASEPQATEAISQKNAVDAELSFLKSQLTLLSGDLSQLTGTVTTHTRQITDLMRTIE